MEIERILLTGFFTRYIVPFFLADLQMYILVPRHRVFLHDRVRILVLDSELVADIREHFRL